MGYSYSPAGGSNSSDSASTPTPASGVESGSGGEDNPKVTGYVYSPGAGGSGDDTDSGLDSSDSTETGRSVTATVRGVNRNALTGVARLVENGNIISETQGTSSRFVLPAGPAPAVISGSAEPISALDFVFLPDSGEKTTVEDVVSVGSASLSVEYGALEGTVFDAAGNPIPNAKVELTASGAVTQTDANGTYSLSTASGTRQFSILDGAITASADITAFTATTRNFSYAGLDVRVVLPDGSVIPDATVGVADDSGVTDGNGEVQLAFVPPNRDVTVSVDGEPIRNVTSPGEQQIDSIDVTLGAGVNGTLADEQNGKGVVRCPVQMEPEADDGSPIEKESTEVGEFNVAVREAGKAEVTVASGDPRYETAVRTFDFSEGEFISEDFELTPRKPDDTY